MTHESALRAMRAQIQANDVMIESMRAQMLAAKQRQDWAQHQPNALNQLAGMQNVASANGNVGRIFIQDTLARPAPKLEPWQLPDCHHCGSVRMRSEPGDAWQRNPRSCGACGAQDCDPGAAE